MRREKNQCGCNNVKVFFLIEEKRTNVPLHVCLVMRTRILSNRNILHFVIEGERPRKRYLSGVFLLGLNPHAYVRRIKATAIPTHSTSDTTTIIIKQGPFRAALAKWSDTVSSPH